MPQALCTEVSVYVTFARSGYHPSKRETRNKKKNIRGRYIREIREITIREVRGIGQEDTQGREVHKN